MVICIHIYAFLGHKKNLDVLKKSKGAVTPVKKLCEINPDILLVAIKKTPHIWRRESQKTSRKWTFLAHVIMEYLFWPPVSQIWFLKRLGCHRHPLELRKIIPIKASLKTTKRLMYHRINLVLASRLQLLMPRSNILHILSQEINISPFSISFLY